MSQVGQFFSFFNILFRQSWDWNRSNTAYRESSPNFDHGLKEAQKLNFDLKEAQK